MNSVTKLYLKLFLWFGIGFAVFLQIFDTIGGDPFNLPLLLVRALIFGTFMSLVLGTHHLSHLKAIGIENITTANLGPRQMKILSSKIEKQDLIEKLKTDPFIRKMKLTDYENQIALNSNITWRSFGELISIKVNKTGDQLYEYKISSKPKIRPTMIDYGKGLLNVTRIEKLLDDIG